MSKTLRRVRMLALAAASAVAIGSALYGRPAVAKDFTYDAKANAEVAKKLKIPVYFAVPASARLKTLGEIDIPDRLVDWKHPDAMDAKGEVGLRVAVVRRAGMAQRLAKSGLIQTGDILLTVRPEWAGGGPYPSIQMGISHTGLAYIRNGVVHNIDNPLDQEYLGPGYRSDLVSGHYNTLNMLHIIRPRNLTPEQKANIEAWATRMNSTAPRIYPAKISFNTDYNAPKYQSGKPITFVTHLGSAGLGQNPQGNVGMFCSEFVWSLLALRNCDPNKTADAFKQLSGVPSCVRPIMDPLRVTGDYVGRGWRYSNVGLADGPLAVIDSMKLDDAKRRDLIKSIFTDNPASLSKMSPGHRKLAQDLKPKFEPLQKYYEGSFGLLGPGFEARYIGYRFNHAVPENYSPTSYLINTLLQQNNTHRVMDYVATLLIE